LGQKIIAENLRQSGVTVEIHDHHFPQNALDEDWLSEVGERGWIVPKTIEFAIGRRHWKRIAETKCEFLFLAAVR
jgi:hypothetical protein